MEYLWEVTNQIAAPIVTNGHDVEEKWRDVIPQRFVVKE